MKSVKFAEKLVVNEEEEMNKELLEELQAQDEYFARKGAGGSLSNQQQAAKCIRMNRKPICGVLKKTKFDQKPHTTEEVKEELEQQTVDRIETQLIFPVQERFSGFFEVPDRCVPFVYETPGLDKDEGCSGFPDVWDLSAQYSADQLPSTSTLTEGEKHEVHHSDGIKSIFAAEFDRLNGKRKKESLFKQKQREAELAKEFDVAAAKEETMKEAEAIPAGPANFEDEAIKNLEVINPNDDEDAYARLAMDAVELDFVTKCMRSTLPRQEQTILRLFEAMKFAPDDFTENSPEYGLRVLARTKVDQIKELYLEEVLVEENKLVIRFSRDVNPILNGAWSFVPIRRVLDSMQDRDPTQDDVEIVSLALLWSIMLILERPTLFFSFSQPSDIYCRMAEIFLIGPKVFQDDVISKSISVLFSSFLVVKAKQNLLGLRLTKSIAALDAFMPFYEELLRRFEEDSAGDENFALFILMGAYMNSAIAPKSKAKSIMEHIKERRQDVHVEVEEQCYQYYTQLLAMYAAAIRDEVVTSERNPIPFAIASEELGEFVKRHSSNMLQKGQRDGDDKAVKELDLLVDIIRRTVAGKLNL
uniref:RNA polymerase II-associated protein 1 N-terminal domain-containing protein n=1 Tax=Ditylenchus dipsaci TaxID=166011 RepID=A0A915E7K7_9BILA